MIIEKLEKQSKILKSFINRPTSVKSNALSFLKNSFLELFNIKNKDDEENSIDNISSDGENDDYNKEIKDNLKDFCKLDQFQSWNILDEKVSSYIKKFNDVKSSKDLKEQVKDVSNELKISIAKVDFLIGKKRRNKKQRDTKVNELNKYTDKNENEEAECYNNEKNEDEEIEENSSLVDLDDFEEFHNEQEKDNNRIKSKKHNEEEDEDEIISMNNEEDEEDEENEKSYDFDDFDNPNNFFEDDKGKKKLKLKKEDIDINNDNELEDEIFAMEHGYDQKTNILEDINEYENKMTSEKPWQLKGEIKAGDRPVASLIQENLDFKVTSRPKPLPSTEKNNEIEKMIKIRIANDLFDDPKQTIINNKSTKEKFELNYDKSKKGLAELYEDDFLSQGFNESNAKTQEHYEVEELMEELFTMFNGLTQNTFVGERVKTEMNVLKNVKAIKLEDVSKFIPTENQKSLKNSLKDTTELELNKAIENYNPKKSEKITTTEMSSEELRKKHRQMKRKVHKKIYENKVKRQMNSLSKDYDSKYEVRLAMKQKKDKEEKKDFKSKELKSTKFFNDLNKKRDSKADFKEINISGEILNIRKIIQNEKGELNKKSENNDKSLVKKLKI